MLAAGWRTLHHISFGVYNESRDRETKCRDVPDAGLRRADDGNALADAETRSGAFSASERSEEHTSELQSPCNLVCRLLLEKKKNVLWPPRSATRTDSAHPQ